MSPSVPRSTGSTEIRMPGHSASSSGGGSASMPNGGQGGSSTASSVMSRLDEALDLEYGEYLDEYMHSPTIRHVSVSEKQQQQQQQQQDYVDDDETTEKSQPNPADGWGRRGAAWGLSVAAAFVFLLAGVALAAQNHSSDIIHNPKTTTTTNNDEDSSTNSKNIPTSEESKPSPPVLGPVPSDLQQICSLSEISKTPSNYRQCERRCLKASCCRILNPNDPSSCLRGNERLCKEYDAICEHLDSAHDQQQTQQSATTGKTTTQALQTAEELVIVCSHSSLGDLNRCHELCLSKMCCFPPQQQQQILGMTNDMFAAVDSCLHEQLEECLEYAACEILIHDQPN